VTRCLAVTLVSSNIPSLDMFEGITYLVTTEKLYKTGPFLTRQVASRFARTTFFHNAPPCHPNTFCVVNCMNSGSVLPLLFSSEQIAVWNAYNQLRM
jgi:hypothetical protein